MLRTKSILSEIAKEDGIRISVMSRHTLQDGKTPDKRIVPGKNYDIWVKELGPPGELVGSLYSEKIDWEEYSLKYLGYLGRKDVSGWVEALATDSLVKDITILCIEPSADKCHRRLLAEECQRYEPSLEVKHV